MIALQPNYGACSACSPFPSHFPLAANLLASTNVSRLQSFSRNRHAPSMRAWSRIVAYTPKMITRVAGNWGHRLRVTSIPSSRAVRPVWTSTKATAGWNWPANCKTSSRSDEVTITSTSALLPSERAMARLGYAEADLINRYSYSVPLLSNRMFSLRTLHFPLYLLYLRHQMRKSGCSMLGR